MPTTACTDFILPPRGSLNPSLLPPSVKVWTLSEQMSAPFYTFGPPPLVVDPNGFPVPLYVLSNDALGSRYEQNHVNPSNSTIGQDHTHTPVFMRDTPVSSHSRHHPRSQLPFYMSNDGLRALGR
ncbi:MAG: hypothetical protein TREMPRED_004508, partial [Tremellales sp. Tagirdzhanova-0007]